MKPNRDHIILDISTHEICCHHCGVRYQVKMPIGLGRMVNLMEGFMLIHQHCEKSEEKGNETI